MIRMRAIINVERWDESMMAKILFLLKKNVQNELFINHISKKFITNEHSAHWLVGFPLHPKLLEEYQTTWCIFRWRKVFDWFSTDDIRQSTDGQSRDGDTTTSRVIAVFISIFSPVDNDNHNIMFNVWNN